MNNYKELFYKSQSEIANAIDDLEQIINNLKKCMNECEETILSDGNNITITTKNDEK